SVYVPVPLILCIVGDERPDLLSRVYAGAALGAVALELLVEGGGRAQRAPGVVVDELGVDVALAPEHRQPRALRCAGYPFPDASVDAVPDVFLSLDLHRYFAPA